jgi:hypothetical protein
MVTPISEMPPGTMGFEASGTLTPEDYERVLLPPLREAIENGTELRYLFSTGEDFEGISPGALWEDSKASIKLGLQHASAWKRVAIVTDVDWIRRSGAFFGWMVPGEFRLFGSAELEEAKGWVAG